MSKKLLLLGCLVVGTGFISSIVEAAVCVDTQCQQPGQDSTWTGPTVISASTIAGIRVLNSATVTGNPVDSYYFAGVSNINLGNTVTNGSLTPSGTGTRVVANGFTRNGSASPSSFVSGISISPLKGETGYYIYVQACPSGAALANSSLCSDWTLAGTTSFPTAAYPSSVFVDPPVSPGDSTVSSIKARIDIGSSPKVLASDLATISSAYLSVTNVQTGVTTALSDSPLDFQTQFPAGQSYVHDITSSEYPFIPNTKYKYQGQLQYQYDRVPGTPQVVSNSKPFWTVPVNPGTLSLVSKTHCSATFNVQNAATSTTNPTYTYYRVCLNGNICPSDIPIGGTGSQTDSQTFVIPNLTSGQTYTSGSQARVGNGSDASANAWNSSGVTAGPSVTPTSWGGTFDISGVQSDRAVFNIRVLDTSGVISYQMLLNGAAYGSVVNSAPTVPSAITLSTLTANKAYNAKIRLSEGTCSSDLPSSGLDFVTPAVAPTAFTFHQTGPRSLSASWIDSVNDNVGPGTIYHVKYCTDLAMSQNCQNVNTTAVNQFSFPSLTTGVLPETQYFAQVQALGISGGTDSAYFPATPATVTTPNEAPTAPDPSCTFNSNQTQANCTENSTDNGPTSDLLYHWTVSAPGQLSANDQIGTNTVTITLPQSVVYTLSVTVTDHRGVGGIATTSRIINLNPNAIPTSVAIDQAGPITLSTQGTSTFDFTATVKDQNGLVITGQSVHWAVTPALGTLTPADGAGTHFIAQSVGTASLTATVNGHTSTAVRININASGPRFTVDPVLTITDQRQGLGTLTATGADVDFPSSIHYVWTLKSGPAAADITPNNSTSGSSAVKFHKAGTYVFTCKLDNQNGGTNPKDTNSAAVQQILSSIDVNPKNITIKANLDSQKFTATGGDQFGDPMDAGNVTWSSAGGGNISGAGVFSAPHLGQSIVVTARNGSIAGAANVNVISFDISNAHAYPVPYRAIDGPTIHFVGLGSSAKIRIFTLTGRLVTSLESQSDTMDWNVTNNSGEKLASGVYFVNYTSPDGKKDGKIVVVR